MEETVEEVPMGKHQVNQFNALIFLEPGKEVYHHAGINWWRNEVKLLIQPWWETDAHNVNHVVLVKPLATVPKSLKLVKDVLGLTEEKEVPPIKMSSMDILLWNCMGAGNLGFPASAHVDPIGRSGGIWVLWDPSQANVRVMEANSQMITATISRQDYPDWVLSVVYASPNSRLRDELWEVLKSVA
ncbi:hypothetical protein LOK49_LG13G02622 [Camellia lanceoleosa]|uniref:Uncharacterized protein n=1 Tax=Camellia lanceoleosa TaxID=1840588 RepID=A0ACC0FM59_9ERIC|nr:hypothetical protein LOK49_LG13G02622 [Camellia lanceoleosa]